MTVWKSLLLLVAAMAGSAPAHAAEVLNVAIDRVRSDGIAGGPENVVQDYRIGGGSRIIGVGWDVVLTAFTPSRLNEVALEIVGSDGEGIYISPGAADTVSGTGSYADFTDLESLGLDFTLGNEGLLRFRFFEWIDQVDLAPDALWESGWVYVVYEPGAAAIPEPGSWAMMILGVGATGTVLRRRRPAVLAAG